MTENHDELRDRVGKVESRCDLLTYRITELEKPEAEPAKASRGFSLPDPILWIMIIATALGQGPQVLEIISKVLGK